MTASDTRRYEMLVRVRQFGVNHQNRFPESSVGRQAFAAVAAAVTELSQQAVSRLMARKEGQSSQAQAKAALEEQLDAIQRTARVLARDNPVLLDRFERRRRQGNQALLTTARTFAKNAEPFTALFVAHGLPDAFLADLQAVIEAFGQGMLQRHAGRAGTTEARARIKAALTSGMAAAHLLDVIVANQLHDDPVARAVWKAERRVETPRRTRRDPVDPPQSPVTPTANRPDEVAA